MSPVGAGFPRPGYVYSICNCSACHFDERERGEILCNFEKDFSWRLAPLEMTGQGSELAEQLPQF